MNGASPAAASPSIGAPSIGAPVRVELNGRQVEIRSAPATRLSDCLRDELGLTGTKVGCHAGDCGACTVLLDGEQVCACLVPVGRCDGRAVTTIEAVAAAPPGTPAEALRRAFIEHGAAQCGICTPGMLMAATALLTRVGSPTRAEVETAIGGVLCRCTGYQKIIDAVLAAGVPAANAEAAVPAAGAAVGARMVRADDTT